MRYSPCPDLLLTMDGNLYSEHEDGEQRDVSDIHILMQQTGLKDKKGKEIYEGDIIQAKWNHAEIKELAVIQWHELEASFVANWQDDGSMLGVLDFSKNIEVIGNIYENPELLK